MKLFGLLICLLYLAPFAAQSDEAANANQITLFFYHPPLNYDWSSPTAAAQSGLHSYLTMELYKFWPNETPACPSGNNCGNTKSGYWPATHQLGHTNLHLQCEGFSDFWGGLTSAPGESDLKEVMGGGGTEVVWIEHKGRLFTEEEIRNESPQFYHNGRMNMLTIKVSPQTCQRMMNYITEFKQKTNNHPIFGGLATRARFGRGAGCTEFAVSFLDVGGLLDADMEMSWSRDIFVPYSLVRTVNHPTAVTVKDMGLLGKKTSWADPQDPTAIHLHFYDPELANEWLHKVARGQVHPEGLAEVYTEPSSGPNPTTVTHVILDKRDAPTPTDPLWWDPQYDPIPALPKPIP